METAILSRLRSEIQADEIQFGGVKGSGVDHLLIEVWERVLSGLETPDVAVTLLGIDYEKAFNRMGHNERLKQLAIHGASQHSIDIVTSFLDSRIMAARVGQVSSNGRRIASGSPQGSILCCFLYCVTTQQLGKDLVQLGGGGPDSDQTSGEISTPGSPTQERSPPLQLSLIHI